MNTHLFTANEKSSDDEKGTRSLVDEYSGFFPKEALNQFLIAADELRVSLNPDQFPNLMISD